MYWKLFFFLHPCEYFQRDTIRFRNNIMENFLFEIIPTIEMIYQLFIEFDSHLRIESKSLPTLWKTFFLIILKF